MRAQIVSFHCVLKNRVGDVVSSTFNHEVLTARDGNEMLEGLSRGLENLKKGDRRRIALTAEQAYGFYDPDLSFECSRSQLDSGTRLKVGDFVRREDSNGSHRMFRVIRADHRSVTLDGNHPLAGMDLVFEIEATEARDATPEEIGEPEGSVITRVLH